MLPSQATGGLAYQPEPYLCTTLGSVPNGFLSAQAGDILPTFQVVESDVLEQEPEVTELDV